MRVSIKIENSFKHKEVKNGELCYTSVPIARYGVFDYLGSEIGVSGEPNKLFKVLHPKEELFNQKTIDSLTDIPVYLGHVSDRDEKHSVGFLKEVSYSKDDDSDDKLYGNIVIYNKKAIKKIENEGIKGLSLGFYSDVCKAPENSGYDFVLKNINGQDYGHLAIVEEGRVGKDIKLLDEKTKTIGGIMVLEEIKKFLKENGGGKFSDEDIEKLKITTDNSTSCKEEIKNGNEEVKEETKKEEVKEKKEEIKDEEKEEKKEEKKETKEKEETKEIKDEENKEIEDEGNENSGNFNHKGRPGQVGGSASNGGVKTQDSNPFYDILNNDEFMERFISKYEEKKKNLNFKNEVEKAIGKKIAVGDSYEVIKSYQDAFDAGKKAGEAMNSFTQKNKNNDIDDRDVFEKLALKMAGEDK